MTDDDIPLNADDDALVIFGSAAPVNVTLTTGEARLCGRDLTHAPKGVPR